MTYGAKSARAGLVFDGIVTIEEAAICILAQLQAASGGTGGGGNRRLVERRRLPPSQAHQNPVSGGRLPRFHYVQPVCASHAGGGMTPGVGVEARLGAQLLQDDGGCG